MKHCGFLGMIAAPRAATSGELGPNEVGSRRPHSAILDVVSRRAELRLKPVLVSGWEFGRIKHRMGNRVGVFMNCNTGVVTLEDPWYTTHL